MLARAVTIACVFALTLTASAGPSRARSVTECTKDHVCYCVDQELKVEIQKKVPVVQPVWMTRAQKRGCRKRRRKPEKMVEPIAVRFCGPVSGTRK